MHYSTVFLGALTAFCSSAIATSHYEVINFCNDKKYVTLSNNANGVLQYNAELPSGTIRRYEITGDHSLAVANSTDYWNSSTYKLVLGTNSANGIVYYAVGTANGYPLGQHPFQFAGSGCPTIDNPDGSTKGCADTGVDFYLELCTI